MGIGKRGKGKAQVTYATCNEGSEATQACHLLSNRGRPDCFRFDLSVSFHGLSLGKLTRRHFYSNLDDRLSEYTISKFVCQAELFLWDLNRTKNILCKSNEIGSCSPPIFVLQNMTPVVIIKVFLSHLLLTRRTKHFSFIDSLRLPLSCS
jgi:hypothetical protein